jgi:two-component system KDP operon response regulator KdpE
MQPLTPERPYAGLPPLVGLRLVVVSNSLELAFDRARGLEAVGYHATACADSAALVSGLTSAAPGAIVVDPGRESGFPGDIVARVRERLTAPLLAVGCAGSLSEMLRCFEAGADDYCRPNCKTEEIDLRLRAIFRRMRATPLKETTGIAASRAVLRVGEIEVDQASQTVRKNGVVVSLSPTEFRLLVTMAEHPGEVIPAKALIASVWGNQYAGETHYLRLYVRYLRQKLEDDPSHPRCIVNRWGSGYALEAPRRAA